MQRILVLSGIFGVLTFGILFCKLWQLQVVQHEKLENKAITQQTREISSTANRGTIYDANGDILAISGSVQNVILSPRDVLATVKVDEKDEFGNARSKTAIEAEKETKVQATYDLIADEMSEILGLDREDVMARLKKTKSAYEVLAERWRTTGDQIRAFIDENDLEGCLYLTADSKRYYPYSTMASQVIGLSTRPTRARMAWRPCTTWTWRARTGRSSPPKTPRERRCLRLTPAIPTRWTATTSTPPLTPPSRCTQRRRWRRAFKSLMSPTAASAW
ncbi:MAG: hypothetical protein ACLR53_09195 [Evtepia gabavorous]